MRENWKTIFISDLCEIKYGKALKKEFRSGGDVPVYGSNGIVGYHNEPLVNGATILIGRKGSIGEVHFSSIPCWPIDTTYYVDFKDSSVHIGWFFRLLKTLNLDNLNRSAAIPGLNRNDVYRIKIPIPENYDDQVRIAGILLRAERLIEKRKESIRLLDEFLKSTFLEMVGDPVRNEKGWEKVSLSKLGELNRGVSKHRPRNAPELLGGKFPLIQTGDVSNSGVYITKYTQTYSRIGLEQSKLWKKGTLCITIAANIAKTGILTFDACFPDSVVGFDININESNVLYVHYLFGFFQRILEKNAPQAAQKNINLEILRNLLVPKPPLPLQKQFASIVEKIETIKAKYQVSLEELERLYGSLSQRAFKGELDLSGVVVE